MDPCKVYVPEIVRDSNQEFATLEDLLNTQMVVAKRLQEIILNRTEGEVYDVGDLKDLVNATNSLVALSHKTEEALRKINTLQKFVGIVVEFLRARSDSLGSDLVKELTETARQLGDGRTADKVLRAR